MVKYKKISPKALIKGKGAFWEIAKMVKYKKSPKAFLKEKGALWEIAQMVKDKKLPNERACVCFK